MHSRATDFGSEPAQAHPRKDRRTGLLVFCSEEEAQLIHEAAKRERRTISGYILHAVLQRVRDEHGF